MSDPGREQVLEALVAAMDRLRSPGGCPWDAEQTHRSLAPYAIEEAYELAEAAEGEDRAALREELGDLLLQVVFHARVAQEHPSDPFSLEDVAQILLDKLIRRHPHVFGEVDGVTSASDVEAVWHEVKKRERGGDVLAGVPIALPALARAQKVARRLRREGVSGDELLAGDEELLTTEGRAADASSADAELLSTDGDATDATNASGATDASGSKAEAALGRDLMALVLRAEAAGVDAEAALRAQLRRI